MRCVEVTVGGWNMVRWPVIGCRRLSMSETNDSSGPLRPAEAIEFASFALLFIKQTLVMLPQIRGAESQAAEISLKSA